MGISIRSLIQNQDSSAAGYGSLLVAMQNVTGEITISAEPFRFSILTYNTALLSVSYKGWDRDVAVDEFIRRIAGLAPDIVHLCEIFDNDERRKISRHPTIRSVYPYMTEGPDEADLEEDGGNLILSKTPLLANNHRIFDDDFGRDGFGVDGYANKGVIHIRVRPQGTNTECDVFSTHMQDIAASRILFESGSARRTLYSQLSATEVMIQELADPDTPTFLVGDFNVPAESTEDYRQMMLRLGNPIDLWLSDNEAGSGQTNISDNNFGNGEDATNQRLDYILMKPGQQIVPQLENIEIQKWSRGGRQISDHFGLLSTWQFAARVQLRN